MIVLPAVIGSENDGVERPWRADNVAIVSRNCVRCRALMVVPAASGSSAYGVVNAGVVFRPTTTPFSPFATAQSGFPSALKSPIPNDFELWESYNCGAAVNGPSAPIHARIPAPGASATRSGFPSPFQSAAATAPPAPA